MKKQLNPVSIFHSIGSLTVQGKLRSKYMDGSGSNSNSSNSPFFTNGGSVPVYACPNSCGRVYKYKGNMMVHYKQECGKEPGYMCKFCMKKFTKKGNLKTHLGLIHNSLDL